MEVKALVANSCNDSRQNITRSLQEIGVRDVVEAKDGKEALKLFQKGTFDLVFTEWNAQAAPGQELAEAIRKRDEYLPIIVTTPQTKKTAEMKKACPSASDYLPMPFTTEQVREKVEKYIPMLSS